MERMNEIEQHMLYLEAYMLETGEPFTPEMKLQCREFIEVIHKETTEALKRRGGCQMRISEALEILESYDFRCYPFHDRHCYYVVNSEGVQKDFTAMGILDLASLNKADCVKYFNWGSNAE